MTAMEVCVTTRETIKPSSPTPPHLKTHKLSLLDQLSPNIYLPSLFFYPGDQARDASSVTLQLKTSLCKILTHYYPFAGRLAGQAAVFCTDDGVEFLEAQADCCLSQILRRADPETLDRLYPSGLLWNESYEGSLVVVQLNSFTCGGIALAVCSNHKIADGATVCNFIRDWATAAAGGKATSPEFISAALGFPGDILAVPATRLEERVRCVTRRLLFDALKMAKLKAMVAGLGVDNPTRVEVVTALIYLRVMAAVGSTRPAVLTQPVNLRPRTAPPLPVNSAGNFVWFYPVPATNENEKNLVSLVSAMRKGMVDFVNKYVKDKSPEECYTLVCQSLKEANKVLSKSDEIDVYKCSSLCRYPFEQVDFGWGKPVWVGFSSSVVKNTFHMSDAREGGIEAWVTLEEKDMAVFESDEELLSFASLNPALSPAEL
ncbi:Deacetylvindoline O-acetyltransferase [Bertholletia excelsa]